MLVRLTLVLMLACLAVPATPCAAADQTFNPYRVLLVIGDQWDDPASFLIDIARASEVSDDKTFRPENADLVQLVVMLKSWGIPFDIARLDQEILDINYFLGPDGKPLYGCILWAADPTSKNLMHQDYSVLKAAVAEHGISLVALSNRIKDPVIEELLGVRYLGYNMSSDDIATDGRHFITRGMEPLVVEVGPPIYYLHRVKAEAAPDVKVLARHGKYPAVTMRKAGGNARAIWIGGDTKLMFEQQGLRTVLRRALTCAVGYSLFKTWENRVIIAMDDPGGAQSAYLDHWNYPALTREQIRRRLIEPLKAHNAKLVMNVVPGFVNDEKRRVELSFQQDFTDFFGKRQNHVSTKQGLEDGMREGVFEIQSHGWTHMQPDLESPPGPWWGAPYDGEKAEVGWYREFGDTRRGFRDIPAATQRFHMKTSREWIGHLFGVDPLSFVAGGGGVSLSYNNHTWILAAKEGFGWFCWFGGYLGQDLAVRGWMFQGTPEAPRTIAAQPDAHDKGIAEHPEQFLRTFSIAGPDAVYMGINEYVGYMHASPESETAAMPELNISYDPHYCQFFRENESIFKLDIADWARGRLAGREIVVDGSVAGKVAAEGIQEVRVPAGIGTHKVTVR
ncbi:MAG: hypothetical protein U9N45_06555 [Gemmatimonadota bacterium]|nr:hypothetical protein [Gemmatimonadota bacterium]